MTLSRTVLECFETENPSSALWSLKDSCVNKLTDLTQLVRSDLSKLERKILVTLITIDVHARDIVEELARDNVTSSNEFGWQMQLRYYWNDDTDDINVRQTNANFIYGYEYLGAQPRLVVTPMTDRQVDRWVE